MITVKCYGKEHKYNTKEQAIKKFIECIACSEGSEQSRYASILYQLYNDYTYCTDEQ